MSFTLGAQLNSQLSYSSHSRDWSQKHARVFCWLLIILCTSLFSDITHAQTIDSGSPIKIQGVSSQLLENIEIHLELQDGKIPLSGLGFPRSNEYILNKTNQALQALGYYHPQINLSGNYTGWQLKITPGEPTRWKNVQIEISGEGKENKQLKQFSINHPFISQQVVNHKTYGQYKKQLLATANEYGYLNAQFVKSLLEVDKKNKQANIVWLFETGTQFQLNSIQLKGSALSDNFLQYYLKIQPGENYQQSKIIETQQALNRSGYFQSIVVTQDIDKKKNLVDIEFSLKDIDKYELKTSIGYGTDSKQRFGISWRDNRVNDVGENYILSAEHSKIKDEVSIQYNKPFKEISADWINQLSYRIKNDQLGRSKQSRYISKILTKHTPLWSTQWSLTFATEENTNNEDISSYLEYLVPSFQADYYSVEDPFGADSGWRWKGTINFSHESLSDPDIDFIQYHQQAKVIWKLSENWRFMLRNDIGYTHMPLDEFNANMPSDYRFLAGGDVSVRGFKYQALGPESENDKKLGGKHLLTASAELDYQFAENWRWAIFSDHGNAFNNWSNYEIRHSLGTGIRWITPIGSLRIDVAKGLDKQDDWRWHITIGPDL